MEDSVKTTHKEAIAQSIASLTSQLASGNSEALTKHLRTMAMFHAYSFGNQMLIALQKPTASRVAGFHTWKGLGRSVKKGEKAIRILAPLVAGKSRDTSTGEEVAGRVCGFRSVCVFDIAQTDGKELPELGKATGSAGDTMAKLQTFCESQGIDVVMSDDLGGAMGMSHGNKISILNGQTEAETVATFIHEVAHEILHKKDKREGTTKQSRELEAEAVAFVAGSAIGLDMGHSSADYIRLYDGNAETLTASLQAIGTASHLILASL